MKIRYIFFLLLFLVTSFSFLEAQIKEIKKPIIPTSSHKLLKQNERGITIYKRKSDNHLLNSTYEVCKTNLNTNTDIVNSYYFSGLCEKGTFNKGYKDGFWKTTYNNKLVKTANWNKGLIMGKYRVYNTVGTLLYQTNFGTLGNGKYKDYFYKTGTLKQEGDYKNGKKQGAWCSYDQKGTLLETTIYNQGIITQ
ncbi:toxin-antitoxin system YwqK family antitoxin [Aquimarina hainanensis]|uniref:Toxin-antitoxin system YwqK family antitoxin n=1 Tax=Aquimarina hainanensis TaxID=1578017 RepID=A0ABW5N568_9FLAO